MFENDEVAIAGLTEVLGRPAGALDEEGLLGRLATIAGLESLLAAAKAEVMVGFHHALGGTSADLGQESPRPDDRRAGPAERRWSGEVLRSVADEIGLVLSTHRRTAARWISHAAVLVERFAVTHALLKKGGLPVAAAHHLVRELAVITEDELRGSVEAGVLAWGQRYGWVGIKQVAHREARKVLAEHDSLLHAQRHAERRTSVRRRDGGVADLVVSTTAVDVAAIMKALTERAIVLRRRGDSRGLDELRTDLAVARLLGTESARAGSWTPAHTPQRQLALAEEHMGASTAGNGHGNQGEESWRQDPGQFSSGAGGREVSDAAPSCGLSSPCSATTTPGTAPTPTSGAVREVAGEQATGGADRVVDGAGGHWVPPVSGRNPAVGVEVVIHCTYEEAVALAAGKAGTGGELEGYGVLPQQALKSALDKARFRYRLTDREPMSDPRRHDPSPGLARHVRDRDRWCRFPGCTSPATRCDLDHRVPFPVGATVANNLEALCRHHHRLKHLGAWRVFVTTDQTLIWISPTSHAHLSPPAIPDAA